MSIPKYLKNLLNTGEGSDFSIFVLDAEGNKIEKKVHKLVIRQCPYFSAMLDLKGTEASSGSTTIDNITSDIFDHVLHYIYSEELSQVTMEQALKIAVAADYLQLDNLKTAALDSWKESITHLKASKDILEAFRALIALSLNIKLDESWRKTLEKLLAAIYHRKDFKIAEESDSFIEFFINSFGKSHPCLVAHTLAEWTSAVDINLTEEQRSERKRRTEDLLTKISLTNLSLQTLVVLSRTEAFPDSYMLKILQDRAQRRDSPVCGKVDYSFTLKTARIIELEFESSYALFRFTGLTEENQDPSKKAGAWQWLRVPDKCKAVVTIWLKTNSEVPWNATTTSGTLGPTYSMKECQFESGEFRIAVSLTHDGEGDNAIKYDYKFVYDQE